MLKPHMLRQNAEILVARFHSTQMLTIHWGASQPHFTCNFNGAMAYSMYSRKNAHKDLGAFQAFWNTWNVSRISAIKNRLTRLEHGPHATPSSNFPGALLWRADSRRRTLQVNQNHSRNRQNTSREIWAFRTPTKIAKHVILYRFHCKHFWKCKKGFTLLNWFHGAGREAQEKL